MPPRAAYDEIADWYATEFLSRDRGADPLEIGRAIGDLLGHGDGVCVDIGCGTGVHADLVRGLGWTPVGVDVSLKMLAYARDRLPIVCAAGENLPLADRSVHAVVAVMVHTDMPAYPAVVQEAARVLRPGGVCVHVGVHPCFCGGFADRSDPEAVVIRPGYRTGHWTRAAWSAEGVRHRVGAIHRPLPGLLQLFVAAGLVLERFFEGGSPTPAVLAMRMRRPPRPRSL